MNRRRFLGAAATVGSAGLAGCGGLLQTRSLRSPPLVKDRPKAVYYPSHVEGMTMAGMQTAGRYGVALSYSFPHRFWIVTSDNRKKVTVSGEDSLHLMVNLWDRETKTVLPTSNVSMTVEHDGEHVLEKRPWPMLSQNMGFHFGDNVSLPAQDDYTVSVTVGPVGIRRTDDLVDAFGEPDTVTFDLSYDRAELRDLPFRRFPKKKGTRGAVDPTNMEMVPIARTPARKALPGDVLGRATSGDAVFLATRLADPPEGIDGNGGYLAVSPRTPYNRYPLPMMSLSARLMGAGKTIFEGPLTATLDPDLGHHYGAVIDGANDGSTLELSVGAPPQVSRHEGYETAFFDMSDVEIGIA